MHCENHDKAWFKKALQNKELIEKLKKITLIITDLDGCLTDGKGYYSGDDEISKCFSIQDGYLITKCNKPGMPHISFLTGRSDKAATTRAKALGIPSNLYFQGIDSDKPSVVSSLQEKLGCTIEETLFFGDDLLDIAARNYVGIFASPANALFYIHEQADIVTPRTGGNGAFRLILDLLLYVQDKHIAQKLLEKSLL